MGIGHEHFSQHNFEKINSAWPTSFARNVLLWIFKFTNRDLNGAIKSVLKAETKGVEYFTGIVIEKFLFLGMVVHRQLKRLRDDGWSRPHRQVELSLRLAPAAVDRISRVLALTALLGTHPTENGLNVSRTVRLMHIRLVDGLVRRDAQTRRHLDVL